jgi:uncharacterized membrane protein YeaQ/YmgE (transglycosylase-associated protein family)
MLLSIIMWAVVGAAVGWLSVVPLPAPSQQKSSDEILVGVLGGLIGGLLLELLTVEQISVEPKPLSVLVALAGAVVLLSLTKVLPPSD